MSEPTDGYGIYENIVSNDATAQSRLDTIASGGFKLVLNYAILTGHIADVISYINHAAAKGLKVIVSLKDPSIWRDNTYATAYPLLYADSGNASTGTAFMQYIVAQLKGLSGVWGWYVCDEVTNTDHAALKTYCDAIKVADASHPRLAIEQANSGFAFSNGSTTQWDCCDVGGDDIYPYGSSYGTWTTVTVGSGTQSFCQGKGIQSAIALQAFDWSVTKGGSVHWPTLAEMIAQRKAMLSNMKPRVALWYSFFDVINQATPDFAPASQWPTLQTAISQNVTTYAGFQCHR